MSNALATPPRALLLATDLSARCDRALARALQLARQWNARLVVATVLPPAPAQELLADVLDAGEGLSPARAHRLAERRLRRELGAEAEGVDVQLRVAEGHVGRTLLQLAGEEGCGLIVTGLAGNPAFELPSLGSTVAWLTRHSPLPVLVVHHRAHHPYRDLVVATDFSDSALQAANHALALFGPPLRLALVHAQETPATALLTGDLGPAQEQARAQAGEQARAFQAGLQPALEPGQVRTVIAAADPARLLRQHVETEGGDLVVVGTHGRGALFELFLGSVAQHLVARLETDTLLVRDTRSQPPATAD